MKKRFCLSLFLAGLVFAPDAPAQAQYTYVDLVKRLTDLEQLAVLPAEGETCQQWSSYDRKSRFDASSGKYVEWDANGDGDGIIRKEGNQLVLAEMEGPGCIWRIWSADPREGHVRIYIDGAEKPAVDLPFRKYFDRSQAPFTRPALVHTLARGWNNYTPIPYAKSCKIVADPGWGLYYQFVYSTFPKGTAVPSFTGTLSAQEQGALDQADAALSKPGFAPPGARVQRKQVRVTPGNTIPVAVYEGPLAIARIRVKYDSEVNPDNPEALRTLALRIAWDGEENASVWAPLGDFFGTAAGLGSYQSLPLGQSDEGWWYCRWYMPFARSARIELTNEGKELRSVQFEIATVPLSKPVEGLGRFHAKWHRDAFLPSEPERQIDWPLLKTEGRGRFVGVMLHIWNPRGAWWGEGDEKFFVDGEKFPSTIGTGSEDYFGYAWCDPALFTNAFHNQTFNGGNNKGHVSVNRWHIADNIPFQKSFDGYIEKYFPNQRPTLYAAMAYWYQAPGGADPYREVPVDQRIGYWVPIETYKIKGAIEGEKLKLLAKSGGALESQDMTGFAGQWSNDAHLWWTQAKPGDRLELALPETKPGKYRVLVRLTKAPDYGVMQFALDGQNLGDPVDLYHPNVVGTEELSMGEVNLGPGQHQLQIHIMGANDKAVKSYMCGLDYVKLEPLP